MQRRRKYGRNGFILSEMLMALFILAIALPLEVSGLKILLKQLHFNAAAQDEIALAQLRRVLNVCYQKKIEEGQLSCEYEGERIEFRFSGNHLYAAPGTWIFLMDIDEAEWQINEGLLSLRYRRNEVIREMALSYE